MNIRSQDLDGLGGSVPTLVGLFLGALVLVVGFFPGAALANSATDQYTESPIPSVPGNTNNESGNDASRAGGTTDQNGSTSTSVTAGKAETDGGEVSVNAPGSGSNAKPREPGDAASGNTQSSSRTPGKGEEAAAIKGFADPGGSATLLILSILIRIPVLAGFGLALSRLRRSRRTDSDEESRLSSALGG